MKTAVSLPDDVFHAADRQPRQWLQESCRLAMVTIARTEILCGPLDLEDRTE